MEEIVFQVEPCEESGVLVASWDAPAGLGGITTQGADLRELQEQPKRSAVISNPPPFHESSVFTEVRQAGSHVPLEQFLKAL